MEIIYLNCGLYLTIMNIERRGGFGSCSLDGKMVVIAGANRYQEFSDIHVIQYSQ